MSILCVSKQTVLSYDKDFSTELTETQQNPCNSAHPFTLLF